VTTQESDLPVLVIDGAAFSDFAGFTQGFSRLLDGYQWRGGLDAFNDILGGGFGTPGDRWTLRWLNSEVSRSALGPTLFAEIVELVRGNGPGYHHPDSGVLLELA
jgi:hypothetical protein